MAQLATARDIMSFKSGQQLQHSHEPWEAYGQCKRESRAKCCRSASAVQHDVKQGLNNLFSPKQQYIALGLTSEWRGGGGRERYSCTSQAKQIIKDNHSLVSKENKTNKRKKSIHLRKIPLITPAI